MKQAATKDACIPKLVARLDERAAARDKLMEVQSTRLDYLERKVSTLDKKIVGAMGGVTIIAYMLQLLVP